jgi:RNA polymerase sigma-70 factor (ECF subfamily)
MKADAEIVRLVLEGDRESFAVLVGRHEKAAWATAWRVLRDEHAASDAAQEAFLQAFHRLHDLREPALFGVWLLRIARREAVKVARVRSRNRTRSIEEESDDLRDERGAVSSLSSDSEEILAALARLPEHERLVVSLRYLEGQSVAEIGEALGRLVGTVTKQLSGAISRLKGKLWEVTS